MADRKAFPESYADPLYASADQATEAKLGLAAGGLVAHGLDGARADGLVMGAGQQDAASRRPAGQPEATLMQGAKLLMDAPVAGDGDQLGVGQDEFRLLAHPLAARRQWVVVGTEAHVCVQQTVLDLLAQGRQVFVVDAAVGSRQVNDKTRALARMQQNGAEIVTPEMVAFEWLAQANTPLFRQVLKEFIR